MGNTIGTFFFLKMAGNADNWVLLSYVMVKILVWTISRPLISLEFLDGSDGFAVSFKKETLAYNQINLRY